MVLEVSGGGVPKTPWTLKQQRNLDRVGLNHDKSNFLSCVSKCSFNDSFSLEISQE